MTLTTDTSTRVRLSADEALRRVVKGSVHVASESSYDAFVVPWNRAIPMTPDVVVVPKDAEDVAAAVRVAGELGLKVGVQATGHGAISSLAGQVLISTSGLDEVTIHPEGWARVGAGELRRVTPTQHAELFFGLRGGKGSLGIVTAIEFDLIPMTTFFGGAAYFDGSDVAAVIERWRRWSADLPEQATTSFVLFQLPPLEFVPPPLAGKLTIGVRFVWTGDAQEGEDLFAPMREVAPVILDAIGVHPYPAIDLVHADPVDPMPAHEAALLLTSFPDQAVQAFLDRTGEGSGSPQVMAEIRQLGGAYARPGQHASAFDHRDAGFSLLLVGIPDIPGTVEHAEGTVAAMAPWAYDGIWPNFGPAHDGEAARRAYRPETLARLRAAAQTYDPAGVLTMGAAIREDA